MRAAGALGLLLAAALPAVAELQMPSTLDLGAIEATKTVTRVFAVRNTGPGALTVRMLAACDCLALDPATFELPAGKSQEVLLSFDPTGSSGSISKLVLARVDGLPSLDRLLAVTGTVGPAATAAAAAECEWCGKLSAEARRQVEISDALARGVLYYYYSPDCPSCTQFLLEKLPEFEQRLGRELEVEARDIREPDVLDELDRLLAWHQMKLAALPVLVTGTTVLQGDAEIRSKLATVLGTGR